MCRASRFGLLLLLLSGALSGSAHATVRTVCSSGCDFTSIQAAHNASATGDTIDVRGLITESPIILSKTLIIRSSLATPQVVQAALTATAGVDRVFYVSPGITVLMENLIIRHGRFPTAGGAVAVLGSLILKRCTLTDNDATHGGAIYAAPGSTLQLTESTMQYNHASSGGGAILSEGANLFIERSTLALNHSFEGGALMVSSGSALIENSTFAMNRANNGGGGLFNQFAGSVTLRSCTFAENSLRAIQSNGSGSQIFVHNSILANSLTSTYLPGGVDCAVFNGGAIVDDGFNLVRVPGTVAFTGPGTVTGVNPQLSVLGEFSGPTRVYLLLPSSPAAGTGNAGGLTTDQRGIARPQGAAADKGAFEYRVSTGENVGTVRFAAPMVASGTIQFGEFVQESVRGPGFALQVQGAGGVFTTPVLDLGAHATYLGSVHALPGAVCAASYFTLTGATYYALRFEDGTEWVNEGSGTTVRTNVPAPAWPLYLPDAGATGSTLYTASVGVDLPSGRYAAAHASNPDDALAMIEHSLICTNMVYMTEVGIRHQLRRVILRNDAASDPYAGATTMDTLLARVTRQWDTVLPAGTERLVLVVRVAPSSAGLADVGTAANPRGYSANDATARGNFSQPWRHEAGHNWSLDHFDGGAPEGQTINSGNQLARFSGPEQAKIVNQRGKVLGALTSFTLPNTPLPPCAATDRMLVSRQSTSQLLDVLANDHDANGDALTLVSVAPLPGNGLGGSLQLTASPGVVEYLTPAIPPTSGIERYSYRIRDSRGQEAVGLVAVRVVDFDPGHSYHQDFDALPDSTQAFTDGSYLSNLSEGRKAYVINKALELTPIDSTFIRSGYTLPVQEMTGGFVLRFRYRIRSNGTPADGFSVGFGQANPSSIISGDAINSYARGLAVEWRTFSGPGFQIRRNNVLVPGAQITSNTLADGVYHSAEVRWHPATGVGLTVDGISRFGNYLVPGFTAQPTDMVSFAAFSGGFTEEVLIDDIVLEPTPSLGVDEGASSGRDRLEASAPNPFRDHTQIAFQLARTGRVRLSVLDLQGRLVKQVLDGATLAAGRHSLLWDGRDAQGSLAAPGVYLYRFESEGYSATRRLVRLR